MIQRDTDGRKFDIVSVPAFPACDNRDQNKIFKIKEWPASVADNWVTRVGFAFNKGGGSIPMDLRAVGWEGIAVLGINTFLRGTISADEMIPTLDELLQCVQMVRDPQGAPEVVTPVMWDTDVQEIATRWWLRSEVVRVHVNFSPLAILSALFQSIVAKEPTSSIIPTSPPASAT